MARKKVKNKVLIDFFPPYGEPEITIVGAVAQVVGITIGLAVAYKILLS